VRPLLGCFVRLNSQWISHFEGDQSEAVFRAAFRARPCYLTCSLTTYRQPPVQPRTPMSWPPPCMHAHLLRLDLAPIQAWIWLTKADPHLKLPPIASLELPSCLADLLMTRSLPNSSRSLNLCSPKVLTLNMKATSFPVNFL